MDLNDQNDVSPSENIEDSGVTINIDDSDIKEPCKSTNCNVPIIIGTLDSKKGCQNANHYGNIDEKTICARDSDESASSSDSSNSYVSANFDGLFDKEELNRKESYQIATVNVAVDIMAVAPEDSFANTNLNGTIDEKNIEPKASSDDASSGGLTGNKTSDPEDSCQNANVIGVIDDKTIGPIDSSENANTCCLIDNKSLDPKVSCQSANIIGTIDVTAIVDPKESCAKAECSSPNPPKVCYQNPNLNFLVDNEDLRPKYSCDNAKCIKTDAKYSDAKDNFPNAILDCTIADEGANSKESCDNAKCIDPIEDEVIDVEDSGEIANCNGNDTTDEEDLYQDDSFLVKKLDDRHRIFTLEEIFHKMNTEIKEGKDLMQTSSTMTRILLNYFNWQKESLYERYYSDKRDDLFKSLKIFDQIEKNLSNFEMPMMIDSALEITCEICLLDFKVCEMMALRCDHLFCLECWKEYFTTKIMNEGITQSITCPGHDCKFLVDDETVMDMITENSVKGRYTNLITNTYVECNRSLSWCPTPQCTNVIKIEYDDPKPIKCLCKANVCSVCGEFWHEPVECHLLKTWLKKLNADGKTSMWIAANTKSCPKCKTIIEKNGGCNHMTCRNTACDYNFCWICLNEWDTHEGFYKCNKFVEEGNVDEARAAILRLSFYSERFTNHLNSLKFENNLYEKMNVKIYDLKKQDISETVLQFLNKAVGVLCKGRRVLMYTYVFAYYLKKNPHAEIFEDNQRDLERSIENLSGYLEKDIDERDVLELKESMIDKYTYCEERCKILLEHVAEGRKQGIWEFHDHQK